MNVDHDRGCALASARIPVCFSAQFKPVKSNSLRVYASPLPSPRRLKLNFILKHSSPEERREGERGEEREGGREGGREWDLEGGGRYAGREGRKEGMREGQQSTTPAFPHILQQECGCLY
eukprot:1595465-Rhodomonas_salina.1